MWNDEEGHKKISKKFMIQQLEILEIPRGINYSDCPDQLIWKYESSGLYSSKSLYAIVNFRGVQPVYLHDVGDLKIPLRIQNFLKIFSQNKILTRDNLRKKGIPKPLECSLCKEIESVSHLFFDCLISRLLWHEVQEIFNAEIKDFLSLASKWLCSKRFLQLNVVSSAIIWTI
jgi:hypothetical protein